MKKVLVTGANGFIGNALCKRLLAEGLIINAVTRKKRASLYVDQTNDPNQINHIEVDDISGTIDWRDALKNVDIIVHLAARVHMMSENQQSSLNDYRRVNVYGTQKLAVQAARAGVKRFVFLSSVKVNGEEKSEPYTESDEPSPKDAYARSKMEAEIELKVIADKSKMEYVILRPPLVYGPWVKANFFNLMRLIDNKFPLPLGGIINQRSFIFLGNLIDCIYNCMTHSSAANKLYLVSDDSDLSTPELVRSIADALEKRCILFKIPTPLLRKTGNLLGKGELVNRLIGSLAVDIKKIKKELAWVPLYQVKSGLQETAKWYKER